MLRIGQNTLVAVCVLSVCMCVSASAADWPNFRGPRHDGISLEKGLQTKWSGSMPLVWERTVGDAYSSFAAVGNRIYTCGEGGGKQVLYCLNADTGDVVWERAIEDAYPDSYGNGTRATPTVDGNRVYILGGHGRLLCVNANDGSEIWSHRFAHVPRWGYSGSVLIEGDLAISSGGGKHGAIVAYDKKTGSEVWKCGSDLPSYGTPYPFAFQGNRYIVGFVASAAVIADAKTGREVGRIPWETDYDINAASPIYHDGHLFLTSGYKTGCSLLKIAKKGHDLSFTPVWQSKVLLNKFQSCILLDGKLYTSDQKAFKCVDFMTGTEHWVQRRMKHGTLVLADGYLYFLTQDGQLQIGKASPNGFNPETKADILSGRCWSVPVLHNGRIYARNSNRVVCFNLKPSPT